VIFFKSIFELTSLIKINDNFINIHKLSGNYSMLY
jgi:hypothetical protein